MTEWGMLLLCAYIALATTGRLTQRQAGGAALALTAIVIAIVMVHYRTTTPHDKYIRALDATVYLTGNTAQTTTTGPPSTEDHTGVQAATWLTTDHSPGVLANSTGAGG